LVATSVVIYFIARFCNPKLADRYLALLFRLSMANSAGRDFVVFFTIGVVVGLLAILGTLLRQRRTLADAQRTIQLNNKLAEIDAQRHSDNLPD